MDLGRRSSLLNVCDIGLFVIRNIEDLWNYDGALLRNGVKANTITEKISYFSCSVTLMSSQKEKVNWINKYVLDSMNTTDKEEIQQLRQEVEKYSKRLYLENFCSMESSPRPKQRGEEKGAE